MWSPGLGGPGVEAGPAVAGASCPASVGAMAGLLTEGCLQLQPLFPQSLTFPHETSIHRSSAPRACVCVRFVWIGVCTCLLRRSV